MSINIYTPFHTRNPIACKNSSSKPTPNSGLASHKKSISIHTKTFMDCSINNQSEECTFQPKINENNKSKRSLQKFLDDQLKYEKNRQLKISNMKQQKQRHQESQITLTPNIDMSSRKIVNYMRQRSTQSIFQRLSREKSIDSKVEPVCSFSPQILNRSQLIKRKSDVSSLLYNDAKRRQEKSQFMVDTQRNFTDRGIPKVNANTNRLVCNKILNQFNNLVSEEEINPLVAILTLEDIFNVDLNPNKLQNTATVHKILAYLAHTNDNHVEIVHSRKLEEFIAIIINAERQYAYFNKNQQEAIYEQFKYFYKKRITKQKRAPSPQQLSFKPQTLPTSNKLAKCYRDKACLQLGQFLENQKVNLNIKDGEITIQDLFILNHLKRQQSNEKKKMQNQRKQLEKCTFKPDVRQSIESVEKYKKQRQQKKQKITLKPSANKKSNSKINAHNISKKNVKENKQNLMQGKQLPPRDRQHKKSIQNIENVTRDMQKIVLRMSAGRQKREFSNKIVQRGYPKDQNWTELQKTMHRKSVQNLQKLRRLSFAEK